MHFQFLLPLKICNGFQRHHHHWMELWEATIENDGFSMVFGQPTIGNDGFSMVDHHWSNDGMVTYHRWSLLWWLWWSWWLCWRCSWQRWQQGSITPIIFFSSASWSLINVWEDKGLKAMKMKDTIVMMMTMMMTMMVMVMMTMMMMMMMIYIYNDAPAFHSPFHGIRPLSLVRARAAFHYTFDYKPLHF